MPYLNKSIFKLFAVTGFLFGAALITTAQNKIVNTAKGKVMGGVVTAPSIVDVWPEGKMPGIGANEPEADRPSKGDGVQRITFVSRPTLTIFPAKQKNAPAIIVCPGGGYEYVTYNKEGTEIAEWLNANGITAVVLKYRVPGNKEGALQDIQRTLSLARFNAKKWNIDPKRLGVMGFSAGGHLAVKASNIFETRSYSPVDSIDKQSSRPDFVIAVYPAYLENGGKVSKDLNLKAKIPPTLLVGTEDDKKFVNGSKVYHAALDEARVSNELLLYVTGGHGYGLRSKGESKAWSEAAINWLQKIGITKNKKEVPVKTETRTQSKSTIPDKKKFHIYLLMGQSNMVGRDTSAINTQIDNPRILALNGDGQWVVAREPIHVGGTGIGPGIPFALEMIKTDSKISIGLIPCAVGGTPLRRWVKGADLYEQCLTKVRKIIPDGVIKGVLWHQGESDTNKKADAETYGTRLSQMFKDLRNDLAFPKLSIVVGQLGDFLTVEKYPHVQNVRDAIRQLSGSIPNVGYADSAGLGHKGDKLHFSADAEKELGSRFAKALQKLNK